MSVTVLMPMGGLGQRFVDAGYTLPKPLIDVDGAPMFTRALESFPCSWDTRHVFVVRSDHEQRFGLTEIIRSSFPRAKIAILDHDTRGAVETCLEARDLIDPRDPLIVADCDIRFHSATYEEHVARGDFEGLLVSFESNDPRYSYAQLDADGNVVRTAEKVVISSHALLGGYCFSSGATFLDLADAFIRVGLPDGLGEYYLSHLFNMLIARNGCVRLAVADTFDIWGTPEELERYRTMETLS